MDMQDPHGKAVEGSDAFFVATRAETPGSRTQNYRRTRRPPCASWSW